MEKKKRKVISLQNENKIKNLAQLPLEFFSCFAAEPRCVLLQDVERRISKMGEHKSQRKTNTDRHCTRGVGARGGGGGGGVEVAAADTCPQSAIKKRKQPH